METEEDSCLKLSERTLLSFDHRRYKLIDVDIERRFYKGTCSHCIVQAGATSPFTSIFARIILEGAFTNTIFFIRTRASILS